MFQFVPFFLQNLPQSRQPVKNPRLHRPQRALQHLGDLFISQPLAEPQDQRLPLPVGQLRHPGPQALFPFRNLRWLVRSGRGAVAAGLVVPEDAQLAAAHPPAAAFAAVQVQ